MITKLSWENLKHRANLLPRGRAYGVPRGGVYAALIHGNIADTPDQADFILDDIIDSGETRLKWSEFGKPFYALVDKTQDDRNLGWVQFPWEATPESDPEESVTRLLQFIGEDVDREGLRETPKRVVKAWLEMTSGYKLKPEEVLGTSFESGGYNQMIVCRDIEFSSTCEHHMLPFVGVAHIGYIPTERVVGLSKMARLVDCFARRLQIQERMTEQIVDTMDSVLKPLGVAAIVDAKHSCMACRGVKKQSSSMITTAIRGMFKDSTVRAEFLSHVHG